MSDRQLEPGTVVLADIPFREGHGSKQRPVLIVGRDGERVIVRAFTTKEPLDARGYVLVEPTWRNGVTRRSWLRPDTCVVTGDAIRDVRGRLAIDLP